MFHAIRWSVIMPHWLPLLSEMPSSFAAAPASSALSWGSLTKRIRSVIGHAIRGSLDSAISPKAICWSRPQPDEVTLFTSAISTDRCRSSLSAPTGIEGGSPNWLMTWSGRVSDRDRAGQSTMRDSRGRRQQFLAAFNSFLFTKSVRLGCAC